LALQCNTRESTILEKILESGTQELRNHLPEFLISKFIMVAALPRCVLALTAAFRITAGNRLSLVVPAFTEALQF